MTVRAGARPGRAEAGDAGLAAAEGKGFAVACDAARIKGYLDGMGVGFVREVLTLGEVDSTNSYLKRLAEGGGAAGALLVAGSQTAGRGRLGRGWVSKASKGIYMSMSLAADGPPECLRLAGMAAAVAVGAVLCEVMGPGPTDGGGSGRPLAGDGPAISLKWPNDVLCEGRKVCGVLAESGGLGLGGGYLVVGLGINVYNSVTDFGGPGSDGRADGWGKGGGLGGRATSMALSDRRLAVRSYRRYAPDGGVLDVPGYDADLMVSMVAREFGSLYMGLAAGDASRVVGRFRERSATPGVCARIGADESREELEALGIDDTGGLRVRDGRGERVLFSGEVTFDGI